VTDVPDICARSGTPFTDGSMRLVRIAGLLRTEPLHGLESSILDDILRLPSTFHDSTDVNHFSRSTIGSINKPERCPPPDPRNPKSAKQAHAIFPDPPHNHAGHCSPKQPDFAPQGPFHSHLLTSSPPPSFLPPLPILPLPAHQPPCQHLHHLHAAQRCKPLPAVLVQ